MKVLFITFFIVIADQVTKILVKGISIPSLGIEIEGMPYQSSKKVFGDLFKITFIENPGMAFGLQIGGKLFLSLFTIAATLLLIFFLYKNRKENLILRLALAFILGGAIGNLIDRVFYGEIYSYAPYFYGRVVDFLHIDFPNFTIFGKTIYSWPIFNIADISVTIGFLMILIGYKKAFPVPPDTLTDVPINDQSEIEYKEYFEGESIENSQNNLFLKDLNPEDKDVNKESEIDELTERNDSEFINESNLVQNEENTNKFTVDDTVSFEETNIDKNSITFPSDSNSDSSVNALNKKTD
ncbi:MAG: signal peptidase II [Ignavibacteria bacterium]